jgi:hypothetical protein
VPCSPAHDAPVPTPYSLPLPPYVRFALQDIKGRLSSSSAADAMGDSDPTCVFLQAKVVPLVEVGVRGCGQALVQRSPGSSRASLLRGGCSLPCSPGSKLLRAHQLHSGVSRGHALPLRHCTRKPTPQPDESLPSYPHPHPAQVVVTPIGRPVTEARVLRVARDITLASLNDIASASIGRAVSAVLERDSALLPLTTDVGTCDSQLMAKSASRMGAPGHPNLPSFHDAYPHPRTLLPFL